MEEALVGAAVRATVQVLLQNLISVTLNEFKIHRNFKSDLEKLRATLATVQEFVCDAETLQNTSKPVKWWLNKLEDVAFQAYYLFDELDYLCLRNNRHKMEPKKTTFKDKIKSMADRRKFSHKIRDINKDFESINREASNLGLQARVAALHPSGVASGSSETDSFTCDPVFLGRGPDVQGIVEKLTNLSADQVLHILPIVGMGGMGKSTLAREVIKAQTRFQTCIWVHVSANFDPFILFKKILMILTEEDVKVEIREVVLKKLKEALANKTYLLVLDDVWNEEDLKWKDFINPLSEITSTKGNCIIVTTRKLNVASIVATLPVHDLQGLPEDSCWSIIKAKAFGGNLIPSEFEDLGKNIAKRCQGLPLAANVVGGVLCGKSKDEWVSIQQNWLFHHVEGDFIQNVLKLSFDNLPSPSHKKCFAYCSNFPKGTYIWREDLIELWMAEGYLQADQKSDMEDVGNKFFNLLLHNSLLQVVVRDKYNNVLRCTMHDLVHDIAMKVNKNISGESYGDVSKEKVKYVRTLFLRGGIFDSMFSNFKNLHALTLMGYYVEELPSSIKELMHLRYLNISETSIEDLPDTIGELYHLLTLTALSLRKLPSTLTYLISLRHLHVLGDTELPGELGKLTSLQTIPYFQVGDEEGYRIVELGSLKNLKGRLKICNLEKVRDKEEAKRARIFQKPNIVELVLHWNEYVEGERNCENVLEGLQPHPNLKRLEIYGFKGTRFPSWALKMGVQDERHWNGLNNLMEIRLERCECEEIPMMGHLPQLKSLYLFDLKNVKSIGSSFYGVCKDTIVVFPALKRLELRNMSNVREWVEVELAENQSRQVEVFPCLEYLVIRYCEKLKSAPSHFPCLKELEIRMVDSGLPLANICGTKLRSLTKLKIWGIEELESLPRWLFYSNQHLLKLDIGGCPRLRDLADGLHTLNSLQDLNIKCCPSLKSVPDCSSGSFTLLCNLEITNCHELLNLSAEMIESCAPSLRCLELGGLRKVMNMQMVIDCLHKMPRLTSLILTSLPKFIITQNPTFSNLELLSMGPDLDSWDCVSFTEVVDGILIRLTSQSLHELRLSGMKDWESLPDQLQHFTGLVSLDLCNFGIHELSEWFGNLSSLQVLALYNCNKLRSLPSVEAMGRLTNLKRFYIDACPLLTERGIEQQSNEHDSQWPNISHIPYIQVDGRVLKEV